MGHLGVALVRSFLRLIAHTKLWSSNALEVVMASVNVFLKDKLLDEINKEAKRQGINRSALIQIALEKYIGAKRRGREEEKRKSMQEASRKTDALANKLGEWDPQATIRKFRDTNLKGES